MSDRNSKDAWAGIVDLEEDAHGKAAAKESQNQLPSTLSNSDTDVDKLPVEAHPLLIERSVTQKDPSPPSLRRKPLAVRSKPIVERRNPAANPKPNPERPSIELPLPESGNDGDPEQRPSVFPQHESLEGLEETQNKSWVPETKGSWKDYREVGVILIVGLLTALLFVVLNTKADPEPKPDADKSAANQRLDRIRRSRAGQLPKTKAPDKVTTTPVRAPPIAPPPKQTAPPVKPKEKQTKAAAKTSASMLSILSTPLGAMVEIDGTVYGKTPLIRMSPKKEGPMKIRLHLSHHKKLETTIQPNEDGHYEANLNLEPK